MSSIILGGFLYFFNIQFSYKNNGLVFYHDKLSINFIVLILLSPLITYTYIKQCKSLKNNYNYYYKIEIYYKYTNNRPDGSQDERRGCFYSECKIKINKAKRSMQILHIRIDRTIHFQLPYTINRRHKITFDLDAPSR